LFSSSDEIDLEKHIVLPENLSDDIYRCRVISSDKIESVEISQYIFKPVKSLKLVCCNNLEYEHKYADRSSIENLFKKRADCDDILIIKNGIITDTSICNVAFFDGINWYTPKNPILKGTKRQKLIDEGKIYEKQIMANDLNKYLKVCAFNAMIEFGEVEIPAFEIK